MITVNPDLSIVVETETHICRLPSYHPETQVPWASEAEATAFAESVAGNPLYMLPKPAPAALRTAVSRTEYYGQFSAMEEAMIRIAGSEEVTSAKLAAANTAEKQRLMGVAALQVMLRRTDALAPIDMIDLASPQVQQGLGLLVQMGLITAGRKTEIEQGV